MGSVTSRIPQSSTSLRITSHPAGGRTASELRRSPTPRATGTTVIAALTVAAPGDRGRTEIAELARELGLESRLERGRRRRRRRWRARRPTAAIAAALGKGLRTADIKSEGAKVVSTAEMGAAIIGELERLSA